MRLSPSQAMRQSSAAIAPSSGAKSAQTSIGANSRNGRRSVNRASARREPQGNSGSRPRRAALAMSSRLAGRPSLV
ncbi:hypothetical protein M2440_002477 [Methylorubrum extorquens]|nr:hypothetical protein [Methylorubrum extorquens]